MKTKLLYWKADNIYRLKMLPDDLLDRVDKEITTHLKSDEELDQLTVDPCLTSIERALLLLSGQEAFLSITN